MFRKIYKVTTNPFASRLFKTGVNVPESKNNLLPSSLSHST